MMRAEHKLLDIRLVVGTAQQETDERRALF